MHAIDAGSIAILDLIKQVGFAASSGEARRLIEQGAVSVDDQKVSDLKANVELTSDQKILRVGKRRVCGVKRK